MRFIKKTTSTNIKTDLRKRVPKEYYKYLDVFLKISFEKLLPYRPRINYEIYLIYKN